MGATEEELDLALSQHANALGMTDVFLSGLDEIKHVYDPVAAREYYLRTRELKGRAKAVMEPTAIKTTSKIAPVAKSKTKAAPPSTKKRKAAEARVAKLKSQFDRLEVILKKLSAERDALIKKSKPADPKSGSSSKSSNSDRKPLTAAQKKEAAKKAKELRDKENPGSESEAKALETKIKSVQKRITAMRKQIALAKKKTQERR